MKSLLWKSFGSPSFFFFFLPISLWGAWAENQLVNYWEPSREDLEGTDTGPEFLQGFLKMMTSPPFIFYLASGD